MLCDINLASSHHSRSSQYFHKSCSISAISMWMSRVPQSISGDSRCLSEQLRTTFQNCMLRPFQSSGQNSTNKYITTPSYCAGNAQPNSDSVFVCFSVGIWWSHWQRTKELRSHCKALEWYSLSSQVRSII